MKIVFIFLSVVVIDQQCCHGAVRKLRSLDSNDTTTQRSYSSKDTPQFADLASDQKRELYSYQQTIVIRDATLDDKVRHCQVVEVYEDSKAPETLNNFKTLLNLEVQKVEMGRMMSLLHDCDSVDGLDVENEKEHVEKTTKETDSPNSLTHGIFPGTKWCGSGDIANSYHDLGKSHNVDRCCRSHDFCPIKVKSKDERYNLTNLARYTKSHCSCDEAFYNCLKKSNGWSAKFIGKLYFDAASPKCIKGLPENPDESMQFVPATKNW